MPLQEHHSVQLLDERGHLLGDVEIGEVRNLLVFGRFREGPDYPTVAPLFAEQREAANQQLFSRVDELDGAIATLGLRLRSADGTPPTTIEDVVIGEGRITFRLGPARGGERERNGAVQTPSPDPRRGERVAG